MIVRLVTLLLFAAAFMMSASAHATPAIDPAPLCKSMAGLSVTISSKSHLLTEDAALASVQELAENPAYHPIYMALVRYVYARLAWTPSQLWADVYQDCLTHTERFVPGLLGGIRR